MLSRPHAARRPMATAMPEGVEDAIRHVEGMRWMVRPLKGLVRNLALADVRAIRRS